MSLISSSSLFLHHPISFAGTSLLSYCDDFSPCYFPILCALALDLQLVSVQTAPLSELTEAVIALSTALNVSFEDHEGKGSFLGRGADGCKGSFLVVNVVGDCVNVALNSGKIVGVSCYSRLERKLITDRDPT